MVTLHKYLVARLALPHTIPMQTGDFTHLEWESCWDQSCMVERETSSQTTHSPWRRSCRQSGSPGWPLSLGHPSPLHLGTPETVAAWQWWEVSGTVTPAAVGWCLCGGGNSSGCTLRRRRLETVALAHSRHHQLERPHDSLPPLVGRLEWSGGGGWGWGSDSWESALPHWTTRVEQAGH